MRTDIGACSPVRLMIAATLLAGIIFLEGCKPSGGDGQKAIQGQIDARTDGRIELVSFEKTNGQDVELLGAKVYIMDYKATIKFKSTCKWRRNTFQTQPSTPAPTANSPAAIFEMVENLVPVSMDQMIDITGKIGFVKKDNGWETSSVEIAQSAAPKLPWEK